VNLYRYIGRRKVNSANVDLSDRSMFTLSSIPSFKVGHHWTLATQDEQLVADELERACAVSDGGGLLMPGGHCRLGEVCDIANGMVSGLDRAFRLSADTYAKLTPKERAATLKVIKAASLSRGVCDEVTWYIDLPVGLDEVDLLRDYPAFGGQLAGFREHLERRYSYSRSLPYWEWAFRRSESFFKSGRRMVFVPCKERLTCRAFARFALVPSGVVATQDVTAISPKEGVRESTAYIAAFLSLPQVSDWVRLRGLMKGGVAEFSEAPVSQIPFRRIDWRVRREVDLHNKISHEMELALGSAGAERGGHLDRALAAFLDLGLGYSGASGIEIAAL
jgi:adenine-specific DNA-methyltransferase